MPADGAEHRRPFVGLSAIPADKAGHGRPLMGLNTEARLTEAEPSGRRTRAGPGTGQR
ncbi:hypothetical protein [Eisenbergiella porci]|uniref:hypothetical protein n=1 Tax=Eisenbergiella porci TaxID=2652274 RepID=UPI0012B20AAD|nr:hypothetical protein [Eisenbergiella porci]